MKMKHNHSEENQITKILYIFKSYLCVVLPEHCISVTGEL